MKIPHILTLQLLISETPSAFRLILRVIGTSIGVSLVWYGRLTPDTERDWQGGIGDASLESNDAGCSGDCSLHGIGVDNVFLVSAQ